MSPILTITLPALMLCASAITATAATKVYSKHPTGEGDPNAITCRPPQRVSSTSGMGPEVCKTNAVWAQYAKDGMVVAPDGIHDDRAPKRFGGYDGNMGLHHETPAVTP